MESISNLSSSLNAQMDRADDLLLQGRVSDALSIAADLIQHAELPYWARIRALCICAEYGTTTPRVSALTEALHLLAKLQAKLHGLPLPEKFLNLREKVENMLALEDPSAQIDNPMNTHPSGTASNLPVYVRGPLSKDGEAMESEHDAETIADSVYDQLLPSSQTEATETGAGCEDGRRGT